jgi:hypothetical protein
MQSTALENNSDSDSEDDDYSEEESRTGKNKKKLSEIHQMLSQIMGKLNSQEEEMKELKQEVRLFTQKSQ